MKLIAAALFVGVLLRHFTATLLPGYTSKVWFYMLGGTWEWLLCAVLALLIAKYHESIERDIAWFALWIGMIEGVQMATCMALISDYSLKPDNQTLCTYMTGFPVAAWIDGIYVVWFCLIMRKEWKRRHG